MLNKTATLHWDLREDARHQHLLAITLNELPSDRRAALEDAVANCGIPDTHCHNLGEVLACIDAASVSDRAKEHAHAIYRILAEAEAAVHGCKLEETHFHEVGNGEAIRNTVAICCAIEALDPAEITAAAVQTGHGTVQCAHGLLDIPTPATTAIIARGIPVCDQTLEGERCTPTSAAIILHFVNRFI